MRCIPKNNSATFGSKYYLHAANHGRYSNTGNIHSNSKYDCLYTYSTVRLYVILKVSTIIPRHLFLKIAFPESSPSPCVYWLHEAVLEKFQSTSIRWTWGQSQVYIDRCQVQIKKVRGFLLPGSQLMKLEHSYRVCLRSLFSFTLFEYSEKLWKGEIATTIRRSTFCIPG